MTGTEVCRCPVLPVNEWFSGGRLVQTRVLTTFTGESDGEAFLASGCDQWMIRCPECGRVYAWGTT